MKHPLWGKACPGDSGAPRAGHRADGLCGQEGQRSCSRWAQRRKVKGVGGGQQGQQLLQPSGTRMEGARGRWSPEEGPGGGQQERVGLRSAEAEAEGACRRIHAVEGQWGCACWQEGRPSRPHMTRKGWTCGAPAGAHVGKGGLVFLRRRWAPPTSGLQPEEGSRVHFGSTTSTFPVKDKAGTAAFGVGNAYALGAVAQTPAEKSCPARPPAG